MFVFIITAVFKRSLGCLSLLSFTVFKFTEVLIVIPLNVHWVLKNNTYIYFVNTLLDVCNSDFRDPKLSRSGAAKPDREEEEGVHE